MSRTLLFVSAVVSSMLLGGCVREGNGAVAMRGPVDAASVHHSDALPASNPGSFETRHSSFSPPAGDHAPRRTNVRP